MKINIAGSGHTGPVKNGAAEWLAYDAKVDSQKKTLEKAIGIIKSNIRGSKACNDAFKALPNRRSFDDIFDDDNVWISYCPDNANYGFTNRVGGSEITMDANAPLTEWDVMWTIRHEFGHVLGFTDCYAEFYDSDIGAIVNYQMDISDLMCSRKGTIKQRHFDQMKAAYLK